MSDSPDIKPPDIPPLAQLADLECETINMVVTLMDGAEVTLPMKMLPQYRMMEITADIPEVKPPVKDFDLKKHGEPVYDYEDKAFLASAEAMTFKRNSVIIAESLLIDIPGETLAEKAEYVRTKFDPLVLEQIVLALRIQREKAKARIVARAGMFPR